MRGEEERHLRDERESVDIDGEEEEEERQSLALEEESKRDEATVPREDAMCGSGDDGCDGGMGTVTDTCPAIWIISFCCGLD